MSTIERECIHGKARNEEKVSERKVDVSLLWSDGVGADLKRPHLREPEIGVLHGYWRVTVSCSVNLAMVRKAQSL